MIANRAARRARLTLTLLCALAATSAAPAQAGQMTVFSCHAPNGQAVGHAGWTTVRTSDAFLLASDTCSESGAGSLHLEVMPNPGGYGNAYIGWVFDAPSWATIAEYNLQVTDSYAGRFNGGAGQAYIAASDESDPVYDYRNLGGGAWEASTLHRTPPDAVSSLTLNSSCDTSCPANVAVSHLDVSSVVLLLDDATVPTVSGLSGSLLSPGPLKGTVEASFSASDSGPGVYSAWLVIDGKPQPRVPLDTNNGLCVDLGQTTNGTRSFSRPDPCAETASGNLTLDTAALTDGQHTIQLDVDDASGNTATVYGATVETHNAPSVADQPAISGEAAVGSTLTGTPATFTAPDGAGALSSVNGAWLRCSDPAGAHCSPIAGATGTTYTPVAADSGYYLVYQSTASDNDGTTSADSPPTLAVTGPASGSGSTSSGGGLVLNINGTTLTTTRLLGSGAKWAISLKGSPLRVRKGTRIVLTGVVSTSPRPAAGKLVEMEARSVFHRWVLRRGKFARIAVYGGWARFGKGEIRTGQAGQWHAEYVMKYAGHYTYQMRAVAPREGGFRNPTGVSNIITITET